MHNARALMLGTLLDRLFWVFLFQQESTLDLILSEAYDDFPIEWTGLALTGNKGRGQLSLVLNLSAQIIVKVVLVWLRRYRPRLFNCLILEMRAQISVQMPQMQDQHETYFKKIHMWNCLACPWKTLDEYICPTSVAKRARMREALPSCHAGRETQL